MSIYLPEPGRKPYLRENTWPMELNLPNDDRDAFNRNPRHRWVYDRLLIAQSQGLKCGPHDVRPARFPVFCTAMAVLDGRESGGRVLWSERDYLEQCGAGNFWMQLLTGERVSTDFAVVAGEVAWCRHASGVWGSPGSIDHWVVEETSRPRLERLCAAWIRGNLAGYTGMMNVETIGDRISTARLRFSGQWPDLYGRRWPAAVVRLHQYGTWDLIETERAEGYSLSLTATHGAVFVNPTADCLRAHEATIGVSCIRLPADGVRLAVINCFNLEVGMRVRTALACEFGLPAENYLRRIPSANRPAKSLKAWL